MMYLWLLILLFVVYIYIHIRLKQPRRLLEKEVKNYIDKRNAILLDVRSLSEWKQQHHPLSRHLPIDRLVFDLEALVPNKDQPIVFCCKRAIRSHAAAIIAKHLGYTDIAYTGYCNSISV